MKKKTSVSIQKSDKKPPKNAPAKAKASSPKKAPAKKKASPKASSHTASKPSARKSAVKAKKKPSTRKPAVKAKKRLLKRAERMVYPDFYQGRECVFYEEYADLFVGRKPDLVGFWDVMADLHKGKIGWNKAFLAQRKTGKTALLCRFLNIMFSEQDCIVPLYYEFDKENKLVMTTAKELVFTFIKQWAAFVTKDPYFVQGIKNEEEFREYILKSEKLSELHKERLIETLERYYGYIEHEGNKKEAMSKALGIAQALRGQVNPDPSTLIAPCVLVLDEVQQLAISLKDEKGEAVNCKDIVASYMTDPHLWLLLSGSKVSMIHYEIVHGGIANKIFKESIDLLSKKEAIELMQKCLAYGNQKAYLGFEEDFYKMVGGNPFYIQQILLYNRKYEATKEKPKSFSSVEELRDVFNFEVIDENGGIYKFWLDHFNENIHLIDEEDPELVYNIVKYIADQYAIEVFGSYYAMEAAPGKVYFPDIARHVQTDLAKVERILYKLEEADFIKNGRMTGYVQDVRDPVFPLAVRQFRYFFVKSEKRKEILEEVKNLVNSRLGLTHKIVEDLKSTTESLGKQVRSVRGDVSQIKGNKKEIEIQEKILGGHGYFQDFRMEDLISVNLPLESGKGYQVDLCGWCEKNGSESASGCGEVREVAAKNNETADKMGMQEKFILAVEIKDREKKVDVGEAKKFIEAIKILKEKKGTAKAMGVYLSRSGFSKPAKTLLKMADVKSGRFEDFGL